VSEEGPYLKSAVFCEKVLREADNVFSLIRIIDRLNLTASGSEVPDSMPKTTYSLNAVIMLIPDKARGRRDIKIEIEEPSGLKRERPFLATLQMEGEERGANLIAEMRITFEHEGLYWFHVWLDDILLTKMPFRVTYGRISTGSRG